MDDLRRSYREGQRVARLHHLPDYATVLQDLQDQPDALAHFQEVAQDPVLMRQLWHAMFLSGMLPQEHYDRAIVEAHAAGHPVFCVDMSEQHQAHEAECVACADHADDAPGCCVPGCFSVVSCVQCFCTQALVEGTKLAPSPELCASSQSASLDT